MQTTARINHLTPTAARPFGSAKANHALRFGRSKTQTTHVVRAKPVDLPTPPGYERAEEFRVERVSFG